MKRTILSVILAAGLVACSVSPVITDPSHDGGDRYGSCRRAARDVCKYRESGEEERRQCVAEATFACVKGGGGD